ncbi:serine/threonine protein kinase [Planctomycetota bacterium]
MGQEIGPYTVDKEIGRGRMWRLYEATNADNQLVALRVFSSALTEDGSLKGAFLRELTAALQVSHPNLVYVFESGDSEGQFYLATELVKGKTLAAILDEEGLLEERSAIEIAQKICSALEAIHEAELVHRDLHPGNIFFDDEGQPKLANLGLALVSGPDLAKLTESGEVLRNAAYLSPEQARGEEELDIRSDLFSLGALLYHMLTGEPVIEAETITEILESHSSGTVRDPAEGNARLGLGACRLVTDLLATDCEGRPADPTTVLRRLDLLLDPEAAELDDGPAEGEEPGKISLVPEKGGKSGKPCVFPVMRIQIGSAADCNVVVESSASAPVAERHCEVFPAVSMMHIRELDPDRGTLLNGRRLTTPSPLKDGDAIRLGPSGPVFHFFAGDKSTKKRGLTQRLLNVFRKQE